MATRELSLFNTCPKALKTRWEDLLTVGLNNRCVRLETVLSRPDRLVYGIKVLRERLESRQLFRISLVGTFTHRSVQHRFKTNTPIDFMVTANFNTSLFGKHFAHIYKLPMKACRPILFCEGRFCRKNQKDVTFTLAL